MRGTACYVLGLLSRAGKAAQQALAELGWRATAHPDVPLFSSFFLFFSIYFFALPCFLSLNLLLLVYVLF